MWPTNRFDILYIFCNITMKPKKWWQSGVGSREITKILNKQHKTMTEKLNSHWNLLSTLGRCFSVFGRNKFFVPFYSISFQSNDLRVRSDPIFHILSAYVSIKITHVDYTAVMQCPASLALKGAVLDDLTFSSPRSALSNTMQWQHCDE